MALGDTLSNKNIKMESMSILFHNIANKNPSIHTLCHSSIKWNQQKKKYYKSKSHISKAIECQNPSGQMKLKWVPKKNGSNKDKNLIPKSNQNVDPHTKRYPTYNKFPPHSKWPSCKTFKILGSKNYHDHNYKFHHPPSQVWKTKND
jgi:hypothetical protein